MFRQATLNQAWGAFRVVLRDAFSFYDIKEIAGLAGVDMTGLARLEQRAGGGASKGQLINALDREIGLLDEGTKARVLSHIAEEIIGRDRRQSERLGDYLGRLGWQVVDARLVPIELFDAAELPDLPNAARADLVKAAVRLRDGDLDGALASACGAVDSSTNTIYIAHGLGTSSNDSFQMRCSKALKAKGTIKGLTDELRRLGWGERDAAMLGQNLQGALNQGAFVMQTLRSRMSDVHGSKRALDPLVFDSLKWAALTVRMMA